MLGLVSLLHSSGKEVRIVLESTGSYHCPVVAALLENGIFDSIANPEHPQEKSRPSRRHADCFVRHSLIAKVDFNVLCDQVLPGMQELMSDHVGRHNLSDFVLRYRHTAYILEMGEVCFRYPRASQSAIHLQRRYEAFTQWRSETSDVFSWQVYAGIDAPPYQSGKFCANSRHISKRGNRYLHKTGYEVMQSYVMHKPNNDTIYAFIEEKTRQREMR